MEAKLDKLMSLLVGSEKRMAQEMQAIKLAVDTIRSDITAAAPALGVGGPSSGPGSSATSGASPVVLDARLVLAMDTTSLGAPLPTRCSTESPSCGAIESRPGFDSATAPSATLDFISVFVATAASDGALGREAISSATAILATCLKVDTHKLFKERPPQIKFEGEAWSQRLQLKPPWPSVTLVSRGSGVSRNIWERFKQCNPIGHTETTFPAPEPHMPWFIGNFCTSPTCSIAKDQYSTSRTRYCDDANLSVKQWCSNIKEVQQVSVFLDTSIGSWSCGPGITTQIFGTCSALKLLWSCSAPFLIMENFLEDGNRLKCLMGHVQAKTITVDQVQSEGEGDSDHDLSSISQQPVAGTESSTCFRLHGVIQGREVLMLIDSGNFISASTATLLQDVQKMQKPVRVRIANGEILTGTDIVPNCKWQCQGAEFATDMKGIPLQCYDVILGIDWLQQHSSMEVDWNHKWIQVKQEDGVVKLFGVLADTSQCLNISSVDLLMTEQSGAVLFLLQVAPVNPKKTALIPPVIQQLIVKNKFLFEEPKGLPPERLCDHKIPLLLGATPAKLRPYRYNPTQKTEIAHPYTALSVAMAYMRYIFKLHSLPQATVSDRDPVFTSKIWQELFCLTDTQLCMSTTRHPQSDGQTERVNQCMEGYLQCFVHSCQTKWIQWLHLAEFWYNSSYRSSLKRSLFEAQYGHSPRYFGIDKVESCAIPQLEEWLKERDTMTKLLQHHLERVQQRMKNQADKGRTETFEVGDKVFLKLQPYLQSSVAHQANHKLAFKFYGPFEVEQKIGSVAYNLKFPPSSMIHLVIHVSQLTNFIPADCVEAATLPEEPPEFQEPEQILAPRTRALGSSFIKEALIRWTGMSDSLATWENLQELRQRFPEAPAWGQAGFQEQGNVTDLPSTEDKTTGPSVSHSKRSKSTRERRRAVRYKGPEWTPTV